MGTPEETIRLVGEMDAGLLVIGADHKLFLDKSNRDHDYSPCAARAL